MLLLFFNIENLKKEKTFLNILNSDFFVLSIIFTIDKLKKKKKPLVFLTLRNLKKEKTFSIIFNIEKFEKEKPSLNFLIWNTN